MKVLLAESGSMTLKGYMISGLKFTKAQDNYEIVVILRCGSHILFEFEERQAAEDMYSRLKETWSGH